MLALMLIFPWMHDIEYSLKFLQSHFHPLSANPQSSQTQSIRWEQLTDCLSVFDHFLGLVLKVLMKTMIPKYFLSSFFILVFVFFVIRIHFQGALSYTNKYINRKSCVF